MTAGGRPPLAVEGEAPTPPAPARRAEAPPTVTVAPQPASRRWPRPGRFELALLAIATAGLLFRVGYVLSTRGDTSLCGQQVCGDAIYYSAQADTIGAGHGFVEFMDWSRQAADHPPLTALFLAPLSIGHGTGPAPLTAQRLAMALVGFAVIVAIGLLGRRAAGPRGPAVGLLAAGIAAVDANLWMNDVIVMSEALAALGIATTLLAVYRFIDRPSIGRAAAIGALIGLTTLARAELALLGPVTFLPVVLWARSLSWPARFGRMVVAGLLAAAVLLPWTMYNATRFDEPVLLSTNDGLTLAGANCDAVYGVSDHGGIGFWNLDCALALADRVPPGADQSVASRIYRQAGVDYLREHRSMLRTVLEYRLLRGWGFYGADQMVWLNQGEGRAPWASWTGYVQWWLLVLPAAAGAVVLRRRGLPVWPLASLAIVVTLTLVLFYGILRFRLAADVAATVLAAVALDAGLVRLRGWWQRRGTGTPRSSGTVEAIGDPPSPEPIDRNLLVAQRSATSRFPCLDAYRGIAMTMILLTHAAYSTGYIHRSGRVPQALAPFLARLDVAVPMFFVLSAFLLYRPFVRATLDGQPLPTTRTFYRRRLLRILPAYWVALVGIGLLAGLQIASVRDWVANALLLPAFGVPARVCPPGGSCHVGYGLPQVWSIGVELAFYLTLPLAAAGIHRLSARRPPERRLRLVLAVCAATYLSATALRAALVVANPSWGEQALLWFPLFVDLFAIGMAFAAFSAAAETGRPVPRPLAWLGEHPVVGWALAGAVFVVVTRLPLPQQPFGLRSADGSSDYLARQFLFGVVAALWLAPAFFGDQRRGRLRHVLSSRPLVYLGAISFSFYLWHLTIIEKVKEWTVPDFLERQALAAHPPAGNALAQLATFTGSFAVVAAGAWLLSLVVAGLVHRLVERPFLELKTAPLSSLLRRSPVPGRVGDGAPTVRLSTGPEPAHQS